MGQAREIDLFDRSRPRDGQAHIIMLCDRKKKFASEKDTGGRGAAVLNLA